MADIKPIYNDPPESQPLPTPYSDVPYSPQGFGAGVGEATQGFASAMSEIAGKQKERADTTAVIGAIGTSRAALNTVVLDPQAGYASTKGQDAITQRDKYLGKFNDAITEAEAGLTNDDQRRAFERHAQVIREEGIRHVYSHEAVQQEDLARAVSAGTVDQTIHSMQWSIDNPGEIEKQVGNLKAIATAEGIRRFGNNAAAVDSVVQPVMQKAAIDGMESAVATQDPKIAGDALERLGPYLLNHERFYAKTVTAMQQKQEVGTAARDAITAASTTVVLPTTRNQPAMQIPRLDPAKVAEQIAALKPDDPLRDDKTKAIEQRQQTLDKVWDVARSQQVAAAQTQGTDPQTGAFSIDRVDPKLKVWLQQNAPDKLIALRALDARAQRQDNGEMRKESQLALGGLLLDMTTPGRREQFYGLMTPEQFTETLNDQPLTPLDRKGAILEFKKIKAEAGKVVDKTTSVARESLAAAFPTNPDQAKKYLPAMLQDLNQFVAQAKDANNGKAPGDEEMRARAAYMLARPPGDHWWNSPDRRIQQLVQQTSDNAKTSAAPVKAVKSYRYNTGRTQRIPVYSDGSEGPKETVQ